MVTKKDLSDQILDKSRAGEFLYCPVDDSKYSANAGDYWNLPDDFVFHCDCGAELLLATEVINVIVKENSDGK